MIASNSGGVAYGEASKMAISEYFAGTYSEARKKFLAAAQTAAAELSHHLLPGYHSPENESLVCDTAFLGDSNPSRLLVLISGTHGLEGFCGSGCQIGYLSDRLYEALPPRSGVLLIHALNPFGSRGCVVSMKTMSI
jgi:hypothetical protein